MANILDYIDWRGDITTNASPFNEVDGLILSEISYIDFADVVPPPGGGHIRLSEASELYFSKHQWAKGALGIGIPDQIQDLLKKAGECARFGDMRVWAYVNAVDEERQMQFSAVCFAMGTGTTCVIFRGTDDTIVGWREDFNMALMYPVPAQTEAAKYLDTIADFTADRLIVAGHSKGGNLAVYASANCLPSTRARIDAVYSNDGPGFSSEALAEPGYAEIKGRVKTVIPKSSVIGMLFNHINGPVTVESTAYGALQHDGLTWQVLGMGFVRTGDLTKTGKRADKTLHALLQSMDTERRKKFVEDLFGPIGTTNVKTLTEMFAGRNKLKNLKAVYSRLAAFDKQTKEILFKSLVAAFREDEAILKSVGEE